MQKLAAASWVPQSEDVIFCVELNSGTSSSFSRRDATMLRNAFILSTMVSPTGVCPQIEMPWYVVGSQVDSSSGVTRIGF